TRNWLKSRGFHSLIVVTSSYHMPRTMVEFAWQMPGVELIPFPVVSEKARNEPLWASGSMQLLLFEYMKYLVAHVRTRIEPAADRTVVAGDRSRPKSCPACPARRATGRERFNRAPLGAVQHRVLPPAYFVSDRSAAGPAVPASRHAGCRQGVGP